MAQKPYKYNIEYIQKFYSHGSEAKVVEFKPVYREEKKPAVPKQEKEPVTTVFIDPIAFCGMMVAIVMLVVMLAGIIQFEVVCQDHAVMHNYVGSLREENILLTQQYSASYNLKDIASTASALGMIPMDQAQTISIRVEVPQRQPDPTVWDNLVWFLAGLFE